MQDMWGRLYNLPHVRFEWLVGFFYSTRS